MRAGGSPPADPPPLSNNAPEDVNPLLERLKEDNAELSDKAADLEMERLLLPSKVEDEETAQKFAALIGKFKGLSRDAEKGREIAKEPFLRNGRTVDSFFKEVRDPLEASAKDMNDQLNVYTRAKAARERAEREAKEREEREKADAARRAEEEARRKAEEATRAAAEEAARIRSAADAEERAEAEQAMRIKEQEAADARKAAEAAATAAASSDRKAATAGKAATGSIGKLSRVAGEGASASAQTFWAHEIIDRAALISELGPLGPHIAPDAVDAAVSKFKAAAVASGRIADASLTGVRFFEDVRTNVRTTKAK